MGYITLQDLAKTRKKEQKDLDIQATIDCGFTLKRVRDMTRTYNLRTSLKVAQKV